CSDALYDAINAAKGITKRGVLVVAAVDDQLPHRDVAKKEFFPAKYGLSNILLVGGSRPDDTLDSDYGEDVLFAPDEGILAATSDGSDQSKGGTSVAAPQVSGAAVLVWSLAPDWSFDQIKRYLMDAADRPRALEANKHVFARLNVERATTAPIEFSTDLEGSRWFHSMPHSVEWSERFKSSACPRGELALQADDENHRRQSFGSYDWKDHAARITPIVTFAGPKKARLIATCEGTSLSAV